MIPNQEVHLTIAEHSIIATIIEAVVVVIELFLTFIILYIYYLYLQVITFQAFTTDTMFSTLILVAPNTRTLETLPAAAGEAAMEDVEDMAGEGDETQTTVMPAAITGVLMHNKIMVARRTCPLNSQITISCTLSNQRS